LSWVHIEEARLGGGIELLVNRKIRQAGLLPELVLSILGSGAIVREEEKKREKETDSMILVEERLNNQQQSELASQLFKLLAET
jgi:hypothetical protein